MQIVSFSIGGCSEISEIIGVGGDLLSWLAISECSVGNLGGDISCRRGSVCKESSDVSFTFFVCLEVES